MNWTDCGLISLKDRDSYAKRAGRTGIFNSGPSDRDLADQIGSAQVLIGAVVSGSGGHGRRASGWRRGSPEQGLPQRRFTGDAQSGTPGVNPSGALAWEDQHFMRDPLEPSARVGDGRSGVRSRGGGPARRRSPSRARVLGSGLGFGSGSECVRRRAHSGALGGVWGLWRGTQQCRAALHGRGFAGE